MTTFMYAPTEARFTVEVESYSPDHAVVRAFGELDMGARVELVDVLDQLLKSGSRVYLDLSGVSFMYSGAANVVIDAAGRFADRIHVFAPTRPVAMIFQALGATDLLIDTIDVEGGIMSETPDDDVADTEPDKEAQPQSFLAMFLDADRRGKPGL